MLFDLSAKTILKDNISWPYSMPSTNSTPWRLEGTILVLRRIGSNDLVCVQNKILMINTFKGEDLNGYDIFSKAAGRFLLYWALQGIGTLFLELFVSLIRLTQSSDNF